LPASNHGSFYYNQLASLKILLGDFTGARNVTDMYFNGIYMNQIVKGGEQVSTHAPLVMRVSLISF
jgi:hypothetical protein